MRDHHRHLTAAVDTALAGRRWTLVGGAPSHSRSFAMPQHRLSAIVIDCQCDDLTEATRFWSAALDRPILTQDQDGDGRYAELASDPSQPLVLLQKVQHPSRVHLDIETDDLDAEVARQEQCGAVRVAFVRERWWVMQAPTGHRYCIVRRRPGR
jgi:hypothetical protein